MRPAIRTASMAHNILSRTGCRDMIVHLSYHPSRLSNINHHRHHKTTIRHQASNSTPNIHYHISKLPLGTKGHHNHNQAQVCHP